MHTGVIRNFYTHKGFGFIYPHDESDDLFFYLSEIQTDRELLIREGQAVSFEIGQNKKGECAVNIALL